MQINVSQTEKQFAELMIDALEMNANGVTRSLFLEEINGQYKFIVEADIYRGADYDLGPITIDTIGDDWALDENGEFDAPTRSGLMDLFQSEWLINEVQCNETGNPIDIVYGQP